MMLSLLLCMYLCVPPDPGIEAAALGASESTLPETASVEALQTFTLDSSASRYFYRDSTTLTPLPAPVPVRIADPSGGPVLAYSSTVLPCPAVPSSSLSGLHLPYELGEYHCPTPGGQRVSIYTCTRTGRHLGTFTRRPRSSLYTLATRPLQVAALAQLSAPGPIALPCSCRLLSHRTLSWHHRLGHPSLPRLHGMHSRLLRAAPHSSSFPLTTAPLQTLHMEVWGPPHISGQGRERYFLLSVSRSASGSARTFLSCIGTLTEVVSSPPTSCGLCRGEGILQSFTLLASPQQNGIAERRIGLVMEVARTSMIHAATPHFLWPFAVQYAAHQLNLWPRVSLSETSPTLRWTGKVGNASAFRFNHPTSRRILPSQDVTFDEVLLPQVDPLPGTVPVEVAVDSGAGRGAASAGAEPKGAGAEGTRAGGTGARGTGAGRAGAGGVGTGDPGAGVAGAVDPGAGGVGAWGAASGGTDSFKERRELECRPPSPVRAVCIGRRVPRPRPPPVPDTHVMALRPSSVLLQVPLPPPRASSLPAIPDPESDLARGASPTVTRLLAVVVTDPSFESTAASALVAEHVDFAAACRLDYATSLVAESESDCPLSVEGECALGTDVLEDKQENFECLAAAIPHLVAMVLAPKGDPDAPDIPTPRSYAQVITGPYSSQWQTAMDAEMASWKSTGTYLDEVPPSGANIVDGMWIFRVNRSPGSLPVFKARYIARGFSQRQGVDFFQTFSPTPKMTTLRVLLHVAAQRDYKLHSLDFSTSFLQGNLHEEIWLHHPPGFTGMTIAALGFAPSTADVSLFLHTDTSLPPFYVLVYDDDLVFATGDTEALALVKSELQKRHTCTDLAPPSDESLEPSGLYPELVGCLIHRPEHWEAAKGVLRYLCSTSGMGLVLGGWGPVVLTGHADASWGSRFDAAAAASGHRLNLPAEQLHLVCHHCRRHHSYCRHHRHLHPHRCHHHCQRSPHSRHHSHRCHHLRHLHRLHCLHHHHPRCHNHHSCHPCPCCCGASH
ncbi:unnamed protein product [Closterium sp. NIES-54]